MSRLRDLGPDAVQVVVNKPTGYTPGTMILVVKDWMTGYAAGQKLDREQVQEFREVLTDVSDSLKGLAPRLGHLRYIKGDPGAADPAFEKRARIDVSVREVMDTIQREQGRDEDYLDAVAALAWMVLRTKRTQSEREMAWAKIFGQVDANLRQEGPWPKP